jgi:Domain of unknown function (DUF4274)
MKLSNQQRWNVAKALMHPEYAEDLSSPEEFHALMLSWNWDYGIVEPEMILDHPDCDKGTAILMYFLGGAGYHRQFSSREEVPDVNIESYDFIMKARAALEADNFASVRMTFDPTEYLDDYDDVHKYWDHPITAKIPIQDIEIELDFQPSDHYKIIEELCESLKNAETILIDSTICTHDCSDDSVFLWANKERFSFMVDFGDFDWNNKLFSETVNLSLNVVFQFLENENTYSSAYEQTYQATGDSFESAISQIVRQWEVDHLAYLQSLLQTSSYTKLRNRSEENIYCMIWSVSDQKIYFDSRLVVFAESVLESHADMQPGILLKLFPDKEAELHPNSSFQPSILKNAPKVKFASYVFIIRQDENKD